MNSNYNAKDEFEINLVDFIWKLLMQWKAVLLTCIIMALLVPGAKLLKDNASYKMMQAEQKEKEKELSMPLEEFIDDCLADLEEPDDVTNIRFILQQQDLVDLQKNYQSKSVWVNTNPASQRNLSIKYYLQRGDVEDMQMLIDTYNTCMRRNGIMKDLRDALGIDTPLEYIYELISTGGGGVADDSVDTVVFTVNVVLPDDEIDADKIAELVDENINRIKAEVEKNLGSHSIRRFNIEDAHTYSQGVTDRRTNISYTINNITNNIIAAEGRLTEEGKEAYDDIKEMRRASLKTDAEAEETFSNAEKGANKDKHDATLLEPSFNFKFAVVGFALGAVLYAGVFMALVIFRRNIESASTASGCSGTRLLGEIYNKTEHKGFSTLLHSDVVSKCRYRKLPDEETQTSRAVASIDAVSEHAGAREVVLFNLKTGSEVWDNTVRALADGLKKNGIDLRVEDIDGEVDEKRLLNIKDAVIAVANDTKATALGNLAGLCREYGINLLGSIYTEEV